MRWSDTGNGCVSYLKDYGAYYKISTCKGIFEPAGEWSDEAIQRMADDMRCNKRMAVKLLDMMHYDYDGFKRYLDVMYTGDVDEFAERIGRFVNNLVRARSMLEQIGNCNTWQYFVTFTIDGSKYDRFDFSAFYKPFSNFVRNYKKTFGVKFDYVFVPEQHADGAWHLHGLVNGLPLEHLRPFRLDEHLPYFIRDKLLQGIQLYDWTAFAERFGWTIVEPLRDAARASSYITKYIGKGFANDDRYKNTRLFMPSLGLKRAEQIKKGYADLRSVKPVYDCEYATTYKFDKDTYSLDDVLKYFDINYSV